MLTASLVLEPSFVVAPLNRRIFGAFVEHMGRCVYTGIYEPGTPVRGRRRLPGRTFWTWLVSLALDPVRYPAETSCPDTNGKTASDRSRFDRGAGPRVAQLENNEVGLDEFIRWASKPELN